MLKKLILVVVALGLLAVGALVVFINPAISSAVRVAVNEGGSKVTGTSVRLEQVEVSLWQGQAALEGFGVHNPEGYRDSEALSFGRVSLEIDPGSVFSDRVIVKRVEILQPRFNFEQTMQGNNLQALQRAIQENLGQPRPATGEPKEPGKKVVIQEILIREATIEASLLGRATSFTLDEMMLESDSEDGITTGEALGSLLDQLLPRIIDGILREVQQLGGIDAEGMINDLQQNSEETLQNATEEVENRVRGALGGFLGGSEE